MGSSQHAKRVTLDDVARAAGVSRATVSRVVNGSKPVRGEVTAGVRLAIDALGYVPNQAARSLITRRTDLVALVAGEPDVRVFTDPFFAAIVHGVSEELASAGIELILSMLHHSSDAARVERFLLAGRVDGVLVISEHAEQEIVGALIAAGLNVVVGGRPAEHVSVPHVDNDNVGGARLAVEHLRSRGCRRIATIAGPADMTAGIDRLTGFREAMGADFDERLVAHGDFTIAGGNRAMVQLLATDRGFDGLFVASDLMAVGAMQVLREEGIRIPDDVAIVGFDDIDLSSATSPPLTTIRQDAVEQGRVMVRLLLQGLGRSGDLPRAVRHTLVGQTSVVLPTTLVRRASA